MDKEIAVAFYSSIAGGAFIGIAVALLISILVLRNDLQQIKKDWKIFAVMVIALIIAFIFCLCSYTIKY